jgi:hypothetical protein
MVQALQITLADGWRRSQSDVTLKIGILPVFDSTQHCDSPNREA